MDDDIVATDDKRRAAQHESVKSRAGSGVKAAINRQAGISTAGEAGRIGEVAGEFRGKAIEETVASEHAMGRARGAARWSQLIDYGFYVIYSLLAVRLVLALIAARPSSGFVRLIHAVTGPLYAPFHGIVPSPTGEGGAILALPVVVAIVAYLFLHVGINGILRMVAHHKTEI